MDHILRPIYLNTPPVTRNRHAPTRIARNVGAAISSDSIKHTVAYIIGAAPLKRNGYQLRTIAKSIRTDSCQACSNRYARKPTTRRKCGGANIFDTIWNRHSFKATTFGQRKILNSFHAIGNRYVFQSTATAKCRIPNRQDAITDCHAQKVTRAKCVCCDTRHIVSTQF